MKDAPRGEEPVKRSPPSVSLRKPPLAQRAPISRRVAELRREMVSRVVVEAAWTRTLNTKHSDWPLDMTLDYRHHRALRNGVPHHPLRSVLESSIVGRLP